MQLRFVVCMKQVPDTTEVRIDSETGTMRRDGVPAITNPFDHHALEQAIAFRAALGGTVTALSMGPPQAQQVLRDAIAVGADEAILLSDPAFRGADTWATALTLAAAIRRLDGVAAILCGKQAIDGDTAQVGPELAEALDLPQLTFVRRVVSVDSSSIVVERSIEGGWQVVRASLPVLLTVVPELNDPRIPSLRGLIRSKRENVSVWDAQCLNLESGRVGLDGSPTRVTRVFTPEMPQGGKLLSGEPRVQAAQLVRHLSEAGIAVGERA